MDLPARAGGLAARRRALLGPSFTSCPLGRELGLRPARLDPIGLRLGGPWPSVRWRGLPVLLWPVARGALYGLPAASTPDA
jgi:hypothetical protein